MALCQLILHNITLTNRVAKKLLLILLHSYSYYLKKKLVQLLSIFGLVRPPLCTLFLPPTTRTRNITLLHGWGWALVSWWWWGRRVLIMSWGGSGTSVDTTNTTTCSTKRRWRWLSWMTIGWWMNMLLLLWMTHSWSRRRRTNIGCCRWWHARLRSWHDSHPPTTTITTNTS